MTAGARRRADGAAPRRSRARRASRPRTSWSLGDRRPDGRVFRYHRLLREFLRAELRRRLPAEARRLPAPQRALAPRPRLAGDGVARARCRPATGRSQRRSAATGVARCVLWRPRAGRSAARGAARAAARRCALHSRLAAPCRAATSRPGSGFRGPVARAGGAADELTPRRELAAVTRLRSARTAWRPCQVLALAAAAAAAASTRTTRGARQAGARARPARRLHGRQPGIRRGGDEPAPGARPARGTRALAPIAAEVLGAASRCSDSGARAAAQRGPAAAKPSLSSRATLGARRRPALQRRRWPGPATSGTSSTEAATPRRSRRRAPRPAPGNRDDRGAAARSGAGARQGPWAMPRRRWRAPTPRGPAASVGPHPLLASVLPRSLRGTRAARVPATRCAPGPPSLTRQPEDPDVAAQSAPACSLAGGHPADALRGARRAAEPAFGCSRARRWSSCVLESVARAEPHDRSAGGERARARPSLALARTTATGGPFIDAGPVVREMLVQQVRNGTAHRAYVAELIAAFDRRAPARRDHAARSCSSRSAPRAGGPPLPADDDDELGDRGELFLSATPSRRI